MQFIDLKAQYSAIRDKVDRRIADVLEHGGYIMGPEIAELESRLSAYCGVKHAVSCANGTDALVLALRALGIGPGDAVFTTPFTFFATAEAIILAGARPVFADIDPRTFNLNPGALEQAIRRTEEEGKFRPRAVITVDLFGLPADYDAIEPLCERHGLDLIDDAAQGFGGEIRQRRAGAFGRVATTSFFPAKPLGCYGDGGAIFTDDAALADLLQHEQLRWGEAGCRGELPVAYFRCAQDTPQGPECGDGQILVHRSWLAFTGLVTKNVIMVP